MPNLCDLKGCILKIEQVDMTTEKPGVVDLVEINPSRVDPVDPTTKEPMKVELEESNPPMVDSTTTANIARFDRN